MATLYEIDKAIQACVDCETGEIIDPEMLNGLVMEREQKIENVVLWIKNLTADAAAYKAEADAFTERKRRAETKIEGLKRWLGLALDGDSFSTGKCAVSWRNSEAVDIPDEALVPRKYMVKSIVYRPDKKLIKDALKTGKKIRGAVLMHNRSAQIK